MEEKAKPEPGRPSTYPIIASTILGVRDVETTLEQMLAVRIPYRRAAM